MSFWSFLGGFALFNMICDAFSSKHVTESSTTVDDSDYDYESSPDYHDDFDDFEDHNDIDDDFDNYLDDDLDDLDNFYDELDDLDYIDDDY